MRIVKTVPFFHNFTELLKKITLIEIYFHCNLKYILNSTEHAFCTVLPNGVGRTVPLRFDLSAADCVRQLLLNYV